MKFVQKEFSHTYEEKKSKFIAHLFPYEMFDDVMMRLKNEHPKARHHVYAYRYLNEFDQVVENSSDDGEPKGTSGKPSLAVLSGAELINAAVIIVRYFGGIKLGTGGLVKAYSNSVNEVIGISDLKNYEKLLTKYIECDYNDLSKVEYILNNFEIVVKNKEFLINVKLELLITQENIESLKSELARHIKFY